MKLRRCQNCGKGTGFPNLCEPCHARVASSELHHQCPHIGCKAWAPPAITRARDDAAIRHSSRARRALDGRGPGNAKRVYRRVLWLRVFVGFLAIGAVAFAFAAAFSGCTISPSDREFVARSAAYYGRTWRYTVAAVQSDTFLHPIEKANFLGRVEDYGLLLEANELRVGLREPSRSP